MFAPSLLRDRTIYNNGNHGHEDHDTHPWGPSAFNRGSHEHVQYYVNFNIPSLVNMSSMLIQGP
jgi:hypothetical protein